MHTQTYTYTGVTGDNDEGSVSRFALVPAAHLDFAVFAGAFASVSIEYVYAFGDRHPSSFQPMAGFGYAF